MSIFEYSIDVAVPLETVYQQWMDFESYPYFMEGVKAVHQLSEVRMLWLGEVGEDEMEWFAEITDQQYNQRLAWKSTSGPVHNGCVLFRALDYDVTRVLLQIEYDPRGFVGNVPAALNTVERRMRGDMQRFKTYIEDRSYSRNAWRGHAQQAFAQL